MGPQSTVCNESKCKSRGRELDPGQVDGHSPPSADSRRVVVRYKRKYVHEELVNSLVKLAQEKSVVM